MRGHGSDRRGRVDSAVQDAGALFFALSWVGHTEPILVNVLTCVRLPQTVCSAGDAPLRFEHLRLGAAYHPEALRDARSMERVRASGRVACDARASRACLATAVSLCMKRCMTSLCIARVYVRVFRWSLVL